ncbi:MAG: dihydroorotase [Bacteroidota bacterium]
MLDLLVKGNLYLDQFHYIANGYLGIKDGLIQQIGKISGAVPAADEVCDATGMLILPGVVDCHVHCLDDVSEGYKNATTAAAAGGVTTLIDHPIDVGGAPLKSADIERKRLLAEENAIVNVGFLAGASPDNLDALTEPAAAGIVGYKALMHRTAPEKMRELNDGELYETFLQVAKTGLFVGVHAENDALVAHLIKRLRAAGRCDLQAHLDSRPLVSEMEPVSRALEFAIATGVRLHIFHVSHPRGFELVESAKKRSPFITAETCPQYLIFDSDDFLHIGTRAKINPPMRHNVREELWQLLRSGQIDLIGSDHAPQSIERKNQPVVFDNSSGMPGVETGLTLMLSEGVAKGRIGLGDLIRVMCENPSKLAGLYPQKGVLHVGSDADLVLVDPNREWVITAPLLHYQIGWTPYEGKSVKGKVISTLVNGKWVYKEEEICGKPEMAKTVRPVNLCKEAR